MEDIPSELSEHNLEEFLRNDSAFVDYFNTFLSLPCFPERIFYNKENDLLEQFTQQLVKDESDNVQLKYDSSSNNVQISYCVTVLERGKALDWLKKYRLSEFIKSGLYAEYNLSKTLSSAQAMYIDTIKNDLSRTTKLITDENSTSPNEDSFFSSNNSIFTTSDECEAGQIEEIINDYVENTGAREVHEKKSESPRIFPGNVRCFPSIIVNEIETDSDGRDEESEISVSVTSDSIQADFSSEFNHNITEKNDSSSDIEGSSVKDDVINYDVMIDDVFCVDVTGDDVRGDEGIIDVRGDDIMDNGVRNGDVTDGNTIDNDVKCDEVIGDDVIGDDVRGGDYGNDVTTINKSTDDGSCVDINNQSSIKFMKSKTTKVQDDVENEQLPADDPLIVTTNTELSETAENSDIQHHSSSISTPLSDVITMDKLVGTEKHLGKDQTEFCKCFHKSDTARKKKLHDKNKDNSVDFKEQSNLFHKSKTSKHSKERYDSTDCTSLSNKVQDSRGNTRVDEDSLDKRLENSSFDSKKPVPSLALNTAEQCSLNGENVQSQLNESNSDSLGSLENKSHTVSTMQETSLQSDVKINDGIKIMTISIDHTDENIDDDTISQEAKNTARGNNLESLSSNIDLSMVEDQTSYHSSDVNLPKTEDQISYNADSNVGEKKSPQKSANTATVENLQLLYDVRILEVDDPASNISENKSEHQSLNRSLMKRTSTLNSIASSDVSECERKSSIADQQGEEMLDNGVNLSSKAGMDKFKEFLINTKGEALLLFWIHVETWKHLGDNGDKIRLLQEMKEQFLRNGSPLELPNEIKKQAGRCFTADLSKTQRIIAEPLRCYWCPRFTLHQFKTQTTDKIQHEAKVGQKTWSSGFQPKSDDLMYPSTHLVRPHSSAPRESLHASSPRETSHASSPRETSHASSPRETSHVRSPRETSHGRSPREMSHASSPHETLHARTPRETLKEGKFHVRSKSAHGRIVTTPCHTNAGKKQLEIYATPQPAEFGFQKRPISAFPPCNDQEYLSSVRLIISPRCKPKIRAAWPQRPEKERCINDTHRNNTSDSSRQDSLVDSLMYRNESGCFFKEFVSKQNNQLWSNCLSFSQAVMDYTAFFDGETLNPATVSRKAQWIYARFITSGSVCDIKLDWKTQEDIRQKLDPPYEELFDCVEDHVLACLKEPWDSLCGNERREYEMIPKKETVRYLKVKLKRTRGSSKNSFLQEELESDDDREHSERGKYSIEEANHPQPLSSDGVSFESVIKDRDELEGFQKYLEKKDPKGVIDLMAWTDMETFQRIPRTIEDKRNKKAKEIRQAYLNSRYFFGPDSPATKEAQNLILSMNGSPRIKERPSSSVILESQKYVRCRIERRWLALYKASQEYKERQNPKQNVSEVVEDIMLRRRLQRSEAAWRVLNSRWVSSSRDIVALRQTLNNPESCLAFRKFVALKGDTYESDVLFWIEIQKYKDLCHRHASEQCIKKKIQAITECFITSSIPPELQVDVPIEMAEKLMERITSRNQNIGPYLFREVQMTVFRVLFNMWKDFCSFRSSIDDGNLLKVLEKRLSRHRAEAKAKKEASERKKIAKQEAERKKKEKEEKEKKELRSMEQLMSLMAENNSTWEQEENDVVFWKYSKHISATVEPASGQKKISTQDDNTSFMELTNQRSIATKSTNQITNSLRSERHTGKVPKSKRFGSLLADSTYSTHSKHSMKGTNSTASRIPRISQPSRNSRARDIKRYDIIDKNSPEKVTSDGDKKQNVGKNKLLKNRERKKSKKILDQECFDSVSNVGKEPASTERGDKQDRVKSPTVKDSRLKSRRKDSPPMEHAKIYGSDVVAERPGSLRTSLLRRQWNQSHDKNRSPVPLTSQVLKVFTNSPEGAPLDTPLSLARITQSDDVSVTKSSAIHRKTPPTSAKKTVKETNLISWRTKRANICRNDIEQFVPDVIVN